jgi:hypothetical protein
MHELLERLSGRAYLKPLLMVMLFLSISPAIGHAECTATPITAVTPSPWVAGHTYDITITGSGFYSLYNPDSWTPTCGIEGFNIFEADDTGAVSLLYEDNWAHGAGYGDVISDSQITTTVKIDPSSPSQTACLFTAVTYYGLDGLGEVSWSDSPFTPSSCIAARGFPVQIIGCSKPTITSIKPNTWFAGKTYDNVAITGTGFTTQDKATDACPVTPVTVTAADGSTVPISNVTVVSKKKITATVAPDSSSPTQTATVKVGTDTNIATTQGQILGNQILCDPSLQCTSDVISTTDGSGSPIQKADVGQPVTLTTPDLPSGITATSTIWTVDGTKIKGYTPSTGKTTVTELKAADMKKKDISFYWVYAKDGIPITYKYCVNIPGVTDPALKCSLDAHASFNASGPGDAQMTTEAYGQLNIDMMIDKTPCLPTSDDEDPYLEYGNISGYELPCLGGATGDPQGIKFTPPETNSNGAYSFVQVLTGNRVRYANGSSHGAFVSTPGLDGAYPYPPLPGYLYVSDSPDSPLGQMYKKVSRTFSANMYLMWTSSKTGSIPVPISSQKWHFKTSTTNAGYPAPQNWTAPETEYVGKDGDPVNYIETAPNQFPYGYPIWKGKATTVWSTTNANEVDQEEEQ